MIPLTARVPVDPTREQARTWAVNELSRKEYADQAPGLVERGVTWLFERLGRLAGIGDASGTVLVAVAVVIALVVAYAVYRAGGVRRRARLASAATAIDAGARVMTAQEHRAAADRHVEQGQWREAAIERFRALARELESQGLVATSPGRTAGELAGEAARRAPSISSDLTLAAATFDDVRYGDHPAGPHQNALIAEVDDQVRTGRLVTS